MAKQIVLLLTAKSIRF